ncbi:hypothetical protein B0H17DRAFT_1123510 [Mycena rosella]|uniref:Uncharacterized protein n=1 Tax=Mycena rosella TaxID=1033263 RepID=A0AAD7H1S4_MYCRO|nr:hypothetical protein B0H17DRAFT_1123510 [Mycena rosella]
MAGCRALPHLCCPRVRINARACRKIPVRIRSVLHTRPLLLLALPAPGVRRSHQRPATVLHAREYTPAPGHGGTRLSFAELALEAVPADGAEGGCSRCDQSPDVCDKESATHPYHQTPVRILSLRHTLPLLLALPAPVVRHPHQRPATVLHARRASPAQGYGDTRLGRAKLALGDVPAGSAEGGWIRYGTGARNMFAREKRPPLPTTRLVPPAPRAARRSPGPALWIHARYPRARVRMQLPARRKRTAVQDVAYLDEAAGAPDSAAACPGLRGAWVWIRGPGGGGGGRGGRSSTIPAAHGERKYSEPGGGSGEGEGQPMRSMARMTPALRRVGVFLARKVVLMRTAAAVATRAGTMRSTHIEPVEDIGWRYSGTGTPKFCSGRRSIPCSTRETRTGEKRIDATHPDATTPPRCTAFPSSHSQPTTISATRASRRRRSTCATPSPCESKTPSLARLHTSYPRFWAIRLSAPARTNARTSAFGPHLLLAHCPPRMERQIWRRPTNASGRTGAYPRDEHGETAEKRVRGGGGGMRREGGRAGSGGRAVGYAEGGAVGYAEGGVGKTKGTESARFPNPAPRSQLRLPPVDDACHRIHGPRPSPVSTNAGARPASAFPRLARIQTRIDDGDEGDWVHVRRAEPLHPFLEDGLLLEPEARRMERPHASRSDAMKKLSSGRREATKASRGYTFVSGCAKETLPPLDMEDGKRARKNEIQGALGSEEEGRVQRAKRTD